MIFNLSLFFWVSVLIFSRDVDGAAEAVETIVNDNLNTEFTSNIDSAYDKNLKYTPSGVEVNIANGFNYVKDEILEIDYSVYSTDDFLDVDFNSVYSGNITSYEAKFNSINTTKLTSEQDQLYNGRLGALLRHYDDLKK